MVIKQITVLPGQRLSLQRHRHRREDWIIIAGNGIVTQGEIGALVDTTVTAWSSVTIEVGVVHRIENPSPDPLVFVEVQCGDHLDEDDIERFEDDYGRVARPERSDDLT